MIDRRTFFVVAALALAAAIATAAQDRPASELRFDTASIRPSASGGPPISGTTIQANRLRGTKVTLLALIRSVYYGEGLTSDHQFEGGPDWIRTDRWDIEAVATITPTRVQFNEMLRNLLADRFKVRVRREQRQLPMFALLVAREDRRLGPALTSVTVDCAAYKEAFNKLQSSRPPREPGAPLQPQTCDTLLVANQGYRLAGRAVELSELARTLTPYFDAPVLDRTGLPGQYDFELTFVRDPQATDGVPLATALREQLGLRVERQQAPMDVVVIESAERPTND
jgi:uncharacterized protein (TIGR03435 family)